MRNHLWKLIFSKRPGFLKKGTHLKRLNKTQELFCQWNAERLGISLEQSYNRYIRSWNAICNGHKGSEFRSFCDLSHEIFSIFFDDSEREIFDAYINHSYLHFLRMLSYEEPECKNDHPIIQTLSDYSEVNILDFGCGLAQRSRSLAQLLKYQGKKVHLFLADIPTIRKHFLIWIGEKKGIPLTFLNCTISNPIPDLPSCHVCIAIEIFEHLHNPISYLFAINDALLPGGFLLTNVSDRKSEFMHVSPKLLSLREELDKLGYKEIEDHILFRKK